MNSAYFSLHLFPWWKSNNMDRYSLFRTLKKSLLKQYFSFACPRTWKLSSTVAHTKAFINSGDAYRSYLLKFTFASKMGAYTINKIKSTLLCRMSLLGCEWTNDSRISSQYFKASMCSKMAEINTHGKLNLEKSFEEWSHVRRQCSTCDAYVS